jgi:uncharacterized membrane protein
MARPKGDKPRLVVVSTKLPPDERVALEAIAAARGITPAELARESLLRTIAEHRQVEPVAS